MSRHHRKTPVLLEVDLRGDAQQELPALDCQVVVDFAQSGQLSRRDLRLEGCGALALGVAGLGTTLNVRDRGGSD